MKSLENIMNYIAAIILVIMFTVLWMDSAEAGWMPDGPVIVEDIDCGA